MEQVGGMTWALAPVNAVMAPSSDNKSQSSPITRCTHQKEGGWGV
jgi:hypothetical protein